MCCSEAHDAPTQMCQLQCWEMESNLGGGKGGLAQRKGTASGKFGPIPSFQRRGSSHMKYMLPLQSFTELPVSAADGPKGLPLQCSALQCPDRQQYFGAHVYAPTSLHPSSNSLLDMPQQKYQSDICAIKIAEIGAPTSLISF